MRNVSSLIISFLVIVLTGCNATQKGSDAYFGTPVAVKTDIPTVVTPVIPDIAFEHYVYIASNGIINQYGIDPDDHTLINLDTQSYGSQGQATISSNINNAHYNNLIMHPNGKWMYATMFDYSMTGQFKINDNGTLSKIGNGLGPSCVNPQSATFNSAGNLIYIKCYGGSPSGKNITSFAINPTTGAIVSGSGTIVATAAGFDSYIANNNLVFPDAQQEVGLGDGWTYAFGDYLQVEIKYQGSLVTYAHDAFIGSALAIH